LRETWEGAALFVAPDDDGDLRAALQSLIEDPTRRKALAARARFRAREFTPERMAAGYLSAYSDLLAAHPPGREEVACA
jgi:glycosyltransferase involved in cell wall biosynthesis